MMMQPADLNHKPHFAVRDNTVDSRFSELFMKSSPNQDSSINSKSSFTESPPSLLSMSTNLSALSSQNDSTSHPRPGIPTTGPLGIQRFTPYVVKHSIDKHSPPHRGICMDNNDDRQLNKRGYLDERARSESPIAVDIRSPRTSSSTDRESPTKSIAPDDEVDIENGQH